MFQLCVLQQIKASKWKQEKKSNDFSRSLSLQLADYRFFATPLRQPRKKCKAWGARSEKFRSSRGALAVLAEDVNVYKKSIKNRATTIIEAFFFFTLKVRWPFLRVLQRRAPTPATLRRSRLCARCVQNILRLNVMSKWERKRRL